MPVETCPGTGYSLAASLTVFLQSVIPFMIVIAYLVSDYFAPSHSFVRREIKALRALGVEVHPFSIGGHHPGGDEHVPRILDRPFWHHLVFIARLLLTRPGVFIKVLVTALRHRPPGLRGFIWSLFHFCEAITLAHLLRKSGANRLHSHFANSGATVGMLAARIANMPWSLTVHGISETDYPAGLLLPEKLRAASFVAIASLFMRAQSMRVTEPEVWSRFHIVRCGIDPATLPSKPEHMHRSVFRIVCVGRLSAEKGYFGLIEALSLLAGQGRDFTVEIVGEGPARASIADALDASGLSPRINLLGALPESSTLKRIAEADVLVLPSLMEGLPVVLIEALALRVPVIASRVAGVPELVEHEVTGLTFTPTDSAGMAHAIARLMDDPALGARLAEAGARRVLDEFTIQSSARRMRALFMDQAPD